MWILSLTEATRIMHWPFIATYAWFTLASGDFLRILKYAIGHSGPVSQFLRTRNFIWGWPLSLVEAGVGFWLRIF